MGAITEDKVEMMLLWHASHRICEQMSLAKTAIGQTADCHVDIAQGKQFTKRVEKYIVDINIFF